MVLRRKEKNNYLTEGRACHDGYLVCVHDIDEVFPWIQTIHGGVSFHQEGAWCVPYNPDAVYPKTVMIGWADYCNQTYPDRCKGKCDACLLYALGEPYRHCSESSAQKMTKPPQSKEMKDKVKE